MSRPKLKSTKIRYSVLIIITHELDRSESKIRVERLLGDLMVQHSNIIEHPQLNWSNDRADVSVRIKHFGFRGVIEIKDGEVLLNLRIPLAAAIFKERIESEILKFSRRYFE